MNKILGFLFSIRVSSNEQYNFTSINRIFIHNDITYFPNSGLTLNHADLNDSSQNYIIIQGIFKTGGIERHHNLINAIVKIFFILNDNIKNFVIQKYITILWFN